MTPINPEIIRRKLGVITENLRRLESIAKLSLHEYGKDVFRKKGAERLLQELIEAAIDILLGVELFHSQDGQLSLSSTRRGRG